MLTLDVSGGDGPKRGAHAGPSFERAYGSPFGAPAPAPPRLTSCNHDYVFVCVLLCLVCSGVGACVRVARVSPTDC